VTDHYLRGPLEQMRGVIGRHPDRGDRYIFEFDEIRERPVHMVGVRRPLRVTWQVRNQTIARETLSPWTGWAVHRADRVIEEAVPE
jgi:hypothetical protein